MLKGSAKHHLKTGERQVYHANTHEKKAGVVVLFPDNAAFRTRKIISDKEGYYILIKGHFSKKT